MNKCLKVSCPLGKMRLCLYNPFDVAIYDLSLSTTAWERVIFCGCMCVYKILG